MPNEWDEFVTAMEDADKAMQAALKTVPGQYDGACKATLSTFQDVRATLVMAYEMRRAEEEND